MTNDILRYEEFAAALVRDLQLEPGGQVEKMLLEGDDLPLDSLQLIVLLSAVEQMGVRLPNDVVMGADLGLKILYDHYCRQLTQPRVRFTVGDTSSVLAISSSAQPPGTKKLPSTSSGLEPQLSNRRFRLAPVQNQDLPFLYDLAISDAVGFRWRYRGAIPTFESFQKDMASPVPAQFTVWSRQGNERVGHVMCYEADLANGFVLAAAMFSPALIGRGLPINAVGLFFRYLFHRFNLRKIYLEMVEFNYEQIASGDQRFFIVEGRLRDHEYYGGRFWDKLILAVYRDSLAAVHTD